MEVLEDSWGETMVEAGVEAMEAEAMEEVDTEEEEAMKTNVNAVHCPGVRFKVNP